VWYNVPQLPVDPKGEVPDSVALVRSVLAVMPWIVLALAVMLGAEAYFVLRRFAREEALRRARQPESQPQP